MILSLVRSESRVPERSAHVYMSSLVDEVLMKRLVDVYMIIDHSIIGAPSIINIESSILFTIILLSVTITVYSQETEL